MERADPPAVLSLRAAAVTAASPEPPVEDVLGALSLVDDVRRELDRLERHLIDIARQRRVSWARIATALGLGSRQAAEQRRVRLGGGLADVRRQQQIDKTYGAAIRRMRAAAVSARDVLAGDSDWDGLHPRATLLRRSLEEAAVAPPSALVALVAGALADAAAMSDVRMGRPARAALDRLAGTAREAGLTVTGSMPG